MTLILGHRGAILPNASFYQNSIAAFEEALTTADGFETDACVDAEGEVFLIHEAKYVDSAKGVEYCLAEHLDAASAALLSSRRLDQLSTAEARRLCLKDGSLLPLLRDVIRQVGRQKGKLINIELKGFAVVEPVLRLVEEAIGQGVLPASAFWITSFNHPALWTVRRRMPGLRIGAIFVQESMPFTPLFPWHPGSEGRYEPFLPAALDSDLLREIQPDLIETPERLLTPETLELVTSRYPKAQLAGWSFTERADFSMEGLRKRLALLPPEKIAAVMVDNPREVARGVTPAAKPPIWAV